MGRGQLSPPLLQSRSMNALFETAKDVSLPEWLFLASPFAVWAVVMLLTRNMRRKWRSLLVRTFPGLKPTCPRCEIIIPDPRPEICPNCGKKLAAAA